jgi:superfamily II DNA or RNA helicase
MKESARSAQNEDSDCSTYSVSLWLDEVFLAIRNPPNSLAKMLTFENKRMEVVKGRRQSVKSMVPEFSWENLEGMKVMVTHQGFWKKVCEHLTSHGIRYKFIDCRIPDLLPVPRLDLMRGFRFSQKEMTTRIIQSGYSGRVALPTRYGKTTVATNIIRAYPHVKTVFFAPGSDLLRQLTDELKRALEPDGLEVKQIGGGSKVKNMSEDVTVCSIDSADKIDAESVRLVLADEIHSIASDSRKDILLNFGLARKIGMTASMAGRYDKRDYLLEGLFGPVWAQRTYVEAVEEKAVEQITAIMVDWPVSSPSPAEAKWMDRDEAMHSVFFAGDMIGRFSAWLANTVIPKEWQTLFFIKTEEQADHILRYIGADTAVAMAKKLSPKERSAMTERVRTNQINRVICSDIYVQGVTFHDVMCLVNLGGGGASTTTIQKPGRLAEIRPDKKGALMVDVFIRPGNAAAESSPGITQLWRESAARKASYEETGYITKVVHANQFVAALLASGISKGKQS